MNGEKSCVIPFRKYSNKFRKGVKKVKKMAVNFIIYFKQMSYLCGIKQKSR